MKNIYIVAAKRTPQGRFLGSLAKRSSVELAMIAGREVLKTVSPDEIDQVIVGNVLSAGQGMNIARQIGVGLNIPLDRPAYTVNMMCASGIQAIILAVQAILANQANTVLCGGTESMSNSPYLLDRARVGYKMGDSVLIDSLLRDGLTDTFSKTHMGLTAESLAEKYNITRESQDAFTVRSQQKCAAAVARGSFNDEIVAVDDVKQDEHPRPDVTIEKLATMKPAFKPGGSVTAGNASGVNDGAAMVIVCDEETVSRKGYTPLARICGSASVGCDPSLMGLGPVYSTQKLCRILKTDVDAFDTIELNEAFAAQALACMSELGLKENRVNPDGGAIALGHPIGASGARLVVHLAHRMVRGESQRGLATLCVGGGMGSSVMLEKA
jgi:acetyl-CoA C-acetyltransferase